MTEQSGAKVYQLASEDETETRLIVRLGDPLLASARDVPLLYGRDDGAEIAGLLPEGELREFVESSWRRWSESNVVHGVPFDVAEASRRVWDYLVSVASPPLTSGEIARLIADGLWTTEYQALRVRQSQPKKESTVAAAKTSEETKAKTPSGERASRIPEGSTIAFGKNKEGASYGDANPKRAGTPSADRFAKYRAGMTVKQAIEAGVTAADIRYDADKGFITLTAPPGSALKPDAKAA